MKTNNTHSEISLITFNTLGTPLFAPNITKRYQKLATRIDESNATVVCLQEVTTYYHLSLLKRYLKRYPYVCYQRFLYGPKGGLVIFSKLPLEKCSYHKFGTLGKLTNIAFYTRLLRNGILSCQIAGTDIRIMTTHLLCDFFFDEDPMNKLYPIVQQQVMDIVTQVNQFHKQGKHVIVCGDFNLQKHSRLYTLLLTETKLIDTFASKDKPTYSHKRVPYRFFVKKEAQIDYILYAKTKDKTHLKNSTFLFDKPEILSNGKKSFLSDHIALKVEFDIVRSIDKR